MTEYDGQNRPLPWDLRLSLKPENTTEDDTGVPSSFVWPEDPTERTLVPFYLSQNEWKVLGSSIDVGRDIAYGVDSIRVLWLWLRNMREAVPICAAIIDCLLTDGDTQAALAELVATNDALQQALRTFVSSDPELTNYLENVASNVTTKILSQTELGRNILKPGACDFGYTFNQASKLIELLDSLSNDLFQAIEVGTNIAERASLLLSAIPGVGIAPFDELLRLGNDLVENVSEEYAGAYDEGLYDELRCALWCQIKDSCELSLEGAFAFYEARLGESLPENPLEGLLAVLQFLDSGDFPGDTVVYAMHLLALAAIRAGDNILGINFARLGLRITAAGDDLDNNYTICEDCFECPVIEVNVLESGFNGTHTEIYLQEGTSYTITAEGVFKYDLPGDASSGPEGLDPDNWPSGICTSAHVVALIGKMGPSGEWFEIGAELTFTPSVTAQLYLTINELASAPNAFEDNEGVITVTICPEA